MSDLHSVLSRIDALDRMIQENGKSGPMLVERKTVRDGQRRAMHGIFDLRPFPPEVEDPVHCNGQAMCTKPCHPGYHAVMRAPKPGYPKVQFCDPLATRERADHQIPQIFIRFFRNRSTSTMSHT